MIRIGIDLGGTKIEGIVLSTEGRELARRRIPTPKGDYDGTLKAIATLVAELRHGLDGKATIGIGMPGAISPATGLVKNANSTWLNGRPFDRDLAAVLHQPVRLQNDANCFAVSEATDGGAAGSDVVFGVIIGTGVGGGVVIRGRSLVGPNAIAGEWGHNPLPWPADDERPGPACYCGRHGCIETYLSGPSFARDHAQVTGEAVPPADIVRRAGQGDPAASASMRRYEDRLARALATVINLLDPDAIVLGGGMSNVRSLYTNVPALLPKYVFSDTVRTKLVPPVHGDSSGVRGAAWLWREFD